MTNNEIQVNSELTVANRWMIVTYIENGVIFAMDEDGGEREVTDAEIQSVRNQPCLNDGEQYCDCPRCEQFAAESQAEAMRDYHLRPQSDDITEARNRAVETLLFNSEILRKQNKGE